MTQGAQSHDGGEAGGLGPPGAALDPEALPSLGHVLRARAAAEPERVAYRFVAFAPDGTRAESSITYDELDRRARAVAALLQGAAEPGDRALLLYSFGPDYLGAFLGCLYAGVVAVPAYPPEYARLSSRIDGIFSDCEPSVVLSTGRVRRQIEGTRDRTVPTDARWLATDEAPPGLEHLWSGRPFQADSLAFLQYTSGSSGSPKGVMISNANLADNLARLRRGCPFSADDCQVTWLPPYHDMGLVVALLSALYNGFVSVAMSPFDFLQSPGRWLQEATLQRATVIGAPNFAYDLCLRKISAAQRAELDLSPIRFAYCAAEPVRAETLARFAEAFGPCGFRAEAFSPAYGMAESTVLVSTTPRSQPPRVLPVGERSYARGRALPPEPGEPSLRIVSCGLPMSGHDVVVVEPAGHTLCAEREVGEIWVAGPSISQGYWRNPEATAEAYGARLEGPGLAARGPFLRTGDLGFFEGGQIYVSGRLKDLIIVRGVNHYPQDIERVVETSHPALRPGCGAAFSVEDGGRERVVVVQEVRPGEADAGPIFEAVRAAVYHRFDLPLDEIVLLEQNAILKTTSGKIARRPCREALLKGELRVWRRWRVGERP
jgi:acyl-CoA synthetase (AMP-forming)/AMP-acid ligase II